MPHSCGHIHASTSTAYRHLWHLESPEQLIAPRSLATDETAGQKSGPASCRILVFGREIRRQASKKDEDRDNDDDEDDELAHSGVLGAIISPLTSTAAEVFAKLIGS